MQVVKPSKIAASFQVCWYCASGIAAYFKYFKLTALALVKIWRA